MSIVAFLCSLLVITSSSFVVDSQYLPPILAKCSSIVDVDPKGEKLVDEDVVVMIESL